MATTGRIDSNQNSRGEASRAAGQTSQERGALQQQEREAWRQRELAAYDVLDTPAESDFDDLVQLAAELCETPIALVSLLDDHRQWFKARFGLTLTETPRELAFCNYALDAAGLLEVGDARRDPRFADNPLVTDLHFRFYAGMPLRNREGAVLGTLCVIDRVPRALNATQRRALTVLGRQVMQQLELRRRLRMQLQIENKLREAEQTLQENSALLEIASETARIGGWKLDLGTRRMMWSDAVRRIHEVPDNYTPELQQALRFYPQGVHRDQLSKAVEECMTRGQPFDVEAELITARGRRLWVRGIGRAQRDAEGNICAIQGGLQDIDERKRREDELNQLGSRLTSTLESISDALFTLDRDWRFTYLNPRAEQLLQRRSADLLGKNVWDEFGPARDSPFHTQYERAVDTGKTVSFVEYYEPLQAWFDVTAYPMAEGLAVYFRNINELMQRQQQLERQALLLDQAKDAIIVRDLDHVIHYWNRSAERLYGWRSEEAQGRSIVDLLYPDDPDAFLAATRQVLETGEWSGRLRQRRRGGGGEVIVEGHWTLISESGKPTAIFAINTDIGERLELEEQLTQAQKLEAIGQLTGGVAHDFNNLLTVIIGNAELLQEALDPGSPLAPIVALLRTAADRGAELTNRLLAFARRQTLEPRLLTPAAIIDDMEALLRRTLGEGIEVELRHERALWNVFVDAAQLETALLNLCVNARDAMPEGGRITIETTNVVLDASDAAQGTDVKPGSYVQILVADTGSGIPPDVLARAFEPFFTTKAKGKGTGLGLSMVYGFVKQSGGHVNIYSEVGTGTSVHLYLPRADGIANAAVEKTVAAPYPNPGRGEQILLVEDNALVREHAERLLRDLGYNVTSAGSGAEALALLRQGLPIDLLFTDVIMPGGLSGPQLAAQVHAMRPAAAVLYTSGYTANAIAPEGLANADVILLQKPYQRQKLAHKVRQALEAARTGV